MIICYYKGDLLDLVVYQVVEVIVVDIEMFGFNLYCDCLCVVQLLLGDGFVDIVQIVCGQKEVLNLVVLFMDVLKFKIFYFVWFDVVVLRYYFGIMVELVWCMKIVLKFVWIYIDRYGLKDIMCELFGIDLFKQ